MRAVIFVVGCILVACTALPANKDEVEYVPPRRTYGDQPVVDTGYFSGWENPFSGSSFGGLFDNIEGIMDRLRKQLASLLGRYPLTKGTNSSIEIPQFPHFGGPFPHVGDIDLSKGNSTSITKIIDGHKVVINETEYKNEDDYGGTFFKVRVIDVVPDSSELTTEKEAEGIPENVTQGSRFREEVENSVENEIPKSKEADRIINSQRPSENSYEGAEIVENQTFDNPGAFDNLETFDEVVATPSKKSEIIDVDSNPMSSEWLADESVKSTSQILTNPEWTDSNAEWNEVIPVDSIESNAISQEDTPHLPIDLSRDTYVNELLAKNGAPRNPDAEVFFVGVPQTEIKQMEKIIEPR